MASLADVKPGDAVEIKPGGGRPDLLFCLLGGCYSHCADHVMDADETGLDCGGASCPLCPICYGP
jgi:hypothetical protein